MPTPTRCRFVVNVIAASLTILATLGGDAQAQENEQLKPTLDARAERGLFDPSPVDEDVNVDFAEILTDESDDFRVFGEIGGRKEDYILKWRELEAREVQDGKQQREARRRRVESAIAHLREAGFHDLAEHVRMQTREELFGDRKGDEAQRLDGADYVVLPERLADMVTELHATVGNLRQRVQESERFAEEVGRNADHRTVEIERMVQGVLEKQQRQIDRRLQELERAMARAVEGIERGLRQRVEEFERRLDDRAENDGR